MTRILFVCLGNICRSPTAEAVFRKVAGQAGLATRIDSAGTGDWHVGKAPHPPATRAAASRGYDLSTLRARQVAVSDFTAFDLILAMDRSNLATLEALRPATAHAEVRLFLDFAPETGRAEVPDPYYTGDYEEALDLVEAASRGLAAYLLQNASAVSPKA